MGEHIERVLRGRRDYERLYRRIEELQSLAEKITPTLAKTPKGKGGERREALWARLADLKGECELQRLAYEIDRIDLERELRCVGNPETRTIAVLRYVDGMKEADIASLMSFDARTVRRKLKKARGIYDRYCERYYRE